MRFLKKISTQAVSLVVVLVMVVTMCISNTTVAKAADAVVKNLDSVNVNLDISGFEEGKALPSWNSSNVDVVGFGPEQEEVELFVQDLFLYIKGTQAHVDKGYINQSDLDEANNGWVDASMYSEEYRIDAGDEYQAYYWFGIEDGYSLEENAADKVKVLPSTVQLEKIETGDTDYGAWVTYYVDMYLTFSVAGKAETPEPECVHKEWNDATCTAAKQCKTCGITSGSALGHNFSSSKVTKNATCTANGTKTYTCSRCSETKTETIKAVGHKYKVTKVNTKATTKKNGKITKQCTVCKKKATETTYYAKSMSLSKTKYVYNGKTQKPTVVVKDSKGKVISSSNYKVTYAKGRKNAGTYKVTVTFKGQYSGKLTKTFKITKAKPVITASNFTKKKSDKAFSINAKVAPKGGKVTYKTSNKKVATVSSKGKVTIKGKGKATITITSASNNNCSKVTKKITVKVK